MERESSWNQWQQQARDTVKAILAIPSLSPLQLFVLGGSMSEVTGHPIGQAHNVLLGRAILQAVYKAMPPEVGLAVQGCEHINRSLVVERWVQKQHRLSLVSVWPVPEAGGSLASAAMELFDDPVVVASVQADAGIDIGQTLIGMHLRPVAVPVRVGHRFIGAATVTAARCRPPLVGGPRARYGPNSKT